MSLSKTDDTLRPGVAVGDKLLIRSKKSSAYNPHMKLETCDSKPVGVFNKFADGDPDDPYNWSTARKTFVVGTTSLILFNSTFASSSPSNCISAIGLEFGITSPGADTQLVLPISLFLVGYIFGPLFFGPLSEAIGRRYVMLVAFAGYTVFTLCCALSPTWSSLLVFRFLSGTFACVPITVGAGIVADVYGSPAIRGRVMTYFMAGSFVAPLIAPAISGYISEATTWRWVFWVDLILAGVSWIPLAFLPETYRPVLLTLRAKKHGNGIVLDGERSLVLSKSVGKEGRSRIRQLMTIFSRPFRMFFTELIVLTTSIYMAVAYAVYYMFFQMYPRIFRDVYKMTPGKMGLMYLPICGGIVLGLLTCHLWDVCLAKARSTGKLWVQRQEFRRLPLVCLGGPLYTVSLFWLGWTAREDIPWVAPCLAGILFGMGNFIGTLSLLNYLTDAYGIHSASVMAAASCSRSIFAAVLPLASGPMYRAMSVGWATSVVGFVSLAMCVVPFLFLHYGPTIRQHSKFCMEVEQNRS